MFFNFVKFVNIHQIYVNEKTKQKNTFNENEWKLTFFHKIKNIKQLYFLLIHVKMVSLPAQNNKSLVTCYKIL
jgi:hypothetical protein